MDVNKELMGNNFDDGLQITHFEVVSTFIWRAFIVVARRRKRTNDNKLYSHSIYYSMNLQQDESTNDSTMRG